MSYPFLYSWFSKNKEHLNDLLLIFWFLLCEHSLFFCRMPLLLKEGRLKCLIFPLRMARLLLAFPEIGRYFRKPTSCPSIVKLLMAMVTSPYRFPWRKQRRQLSCGIMKEKKFVSGKIFEWQRLQRVHVFVHCLDELVSFLQWSMLLVSRKDI